MEVSFSDERHPFKKLPFQGSRVIYTFKDVPEIKDNISCITTDFLIKNAYVEKQSKVSIYEKPVTFLYNKYAFKGPYGSPSGVNRISTAYPANFKATIEIYVKLYEQDFDGLLLPLYVIASYDSSFYLVFPNIYKELSVKAYTYTLSKKKKTYGEREKERIYADEESYYVIDSKIILNILNAFKLIPVEESVPFVSILYNLIKLYAIGAFDMTFDNILLNTRSYAFHFIDLAEAFPKGKTTKIADKSDRYFYINRVKITDTRIMSSHSIEMWSSLLDRNINTIYDMLKTERLPFIDDALERIKGIIKDIQREQDLELSAFEKAAVGLEPPKTFRKVQQKMEVFTPSISSVQKKGKKEISSVDDFSSRFWSSSLVRKQKPQKEEIQDVDIETGLYADIWLSSDKKEEDIVPETVPIMNLSDTLPKITTKSIPPKFSETMFTSLTQRRKVYGYKGGMQAIGNKKDKTYSSANSELNTVNQTASDIYTVGNVISFLIFYIRLSVKDKAFMAATELWRMHEINSIYGTKMLFLTLRQCAVYNIGPVNPTLVLKVVSKTLEWTFLLEKKGSNIDDVLDFGEVLALIEEMVDSDKTHIHTLMQSAYTESKDKTSKLIEQLQLDFDVYSVEDIEPILEQLVAERRDLVEEAVKLFTRSDDIELVKLFIVYYVLLKNLSPNSIVFLDEIINISKDKKIVRGIKKNPIFFAFNILSSIYQNDNIIYFEQFYSNNKTDARTILMYLTTNYILNQKLGNNPQSTKKKLPSVKYLSGDYEFRIDDLILSDLNNLGGDAFSIFPLDEEIDIYSELYPEEYDFYYSIYEQ